MSDIPAHLINTLQKAQTFLTKDLPALPGAHHKTDRESRYLQNQKLFEMLGNPQNTHKVIHVAGTSGKGTVSYLVDAMLRAHDKQTGLLVSPHVYDIRERIQLNGQFISERQFIETLNQLLPFIQKLNTTQQTPHYFETLLLLGFMASSTRSLDYLVVEAGVGGRYSPTNLVNRDDTYGVITQIGLDHTDRLGTTYEQITTEKSGIIKPNMWLTALRQRSGVNDIIAKTAQAEQADLSWVESSKDYETDDLLLALDCVRRLAERDGWSFDEELAKQAAHKLYIPGRYEKRSFLDHSVVLDGAHNPQKLTALSSRLGRDKIAPCTFVLAIGTHKDYVNSLLALKHVAQRIICCEFFLHEPEVPGRPVSARVLGETARKLGFSQVEIIPEPVLAFRFGLQFPEPVVVAGSFYLLGEVDKVFN